MNYFIKIQERSDDFTPSDRKIADFILDHPGEIINLNTEQLAEKTGSSQSAVIRFVQKIGYRGYVELKVDIAKTVENDKDTIQSEVISGNDGVEEIVAKSHNHVLSAVEKTYALIEIDKIKTAVNILKDADSVYLAGVGSSGLLCEDFIYKLQRSGKKAFYERDSHTNLTLLTNITDKDMLICISYGGKTKEIQLAADYARGKKAKVISITKSGRAPLANKSDIVLMIPEIEKEMRYGAISSRFSSQIITDILFYGYVAGNMEVVIENLMVSKGLTDNLKK